jgi:hypothetical protein
MDGLKIQLQKSDDGSTQHAFCNWWLHDHFLGSMTVQEELKLRTCIFKETLSIHDLVWEMHS